MRRSLGLFRKGRVCWDWICRDFSILTLSGNHQKFQTLIPCTDFQYNECSSLGKKADDLMTSFFVCLFPPSQSVCLSVSLSLPLPSFLLFCIVSCIPGCFSFYAIVKDDLELLILLPPFP